MNDLKIVTGSANPDLAVAICNHLGCQLTPTLATTFSDGELRVEIGANVRGDDVFVVQPTCPPDVNRNLIQLCLMCDALKRASAGRITAVVPYYGYARQDRKVSPRAPISAKMVADFISCSGAGRVVTIDLHAGQIQGFFNVPVDHLYASTIMLPYVKSLNLPNLCIATPDVGGSKRASTYAKYLDCPLVLCNKTRKKANVVEDMQIIGNVKGMDVILVDDIVDTAGTITKAADLMMENGANSVRAIASHCVMSGPASQRVADSALKEMVFTDSIPYNNACNKVKQLTVADMFAETIRRVMTNESISSQYLI